MTYTCGNCGEKFSSDIEVEDMICIECLPEFIVGPIWEAEFSADVSESAEPAC